MDTGHISKTIYIKIYTKHVPKSGPGRGDQGRKKGTKERWQ
jgi:hypothetical protein